MSASCQSDMGSHRRRLDRVDNGVLGIVDDLPQSIHLSREVCILESILTVLGWEGSASEDEPVEVLDHVCHLDLGISFAFD